MGGETSAGEAKAACASVKKKKRCKKIRRG
jgi:hypothetical protein